MTLYVLSSVLVLKERVKFTQNLVHRIKCHLPPPGIITIHRKKQNENKFTSHTKRVNNKNEVVFVWVNSFFQNVM